MKPVTHKLHAKNEYGKSSEDLHGCCKHNKYLEIKMDAYFDSTEKVRHLFRGLRGQKGIFYAVDAYDMNFENRGPAGR